MKIFGKNYGNSTSLIGDLKVTFVDGVAEVSEEEAKQILSLNIPSLTDRKIPEVSDKDAKISEEISGMISEFQEKIDHLNFVIKGLKSKCVSLEEDIKIYRDMATSYEEQLKNTPQKEVLTVVENIIDGGGDKEVMEGEERVSGSSEREIETPNLEGLTKDELISLAVESHIVEKSSEIQPLKKEEIKRLILDNIQ